MASLMPEEFHDSLLGKCKFNLDSFYLTNDLYGGYSYDCERGSGAVSYARPKDILEVAQGAEVKEIHLAGDVWTLLGKKGWGEKVHVDEASAFILESVSPSEPIRILSHITVPL